MGHRWLEIALAPIQHRVRNLAARAVLSLLNDGQSTQFAQLRVLEGESRDFVQRVQQYGWTSNPLPGARPVIILCPFGDRAHAVAIAIDDTRHRPTGSGPGDVIQYDHRGNRVHMKDGELHVTAVADLKIVVTGSATIECSDIKLGTGTLQKLLNKAAMDLYNLHTHPDPQGGNVGVPNQQMVEGTHTTTNTRSS